MLVQKENFAIHSSVPHVETYVHLGLILFPLYKLILDFKEKENTKSLFSKRQKSFVSTG